MPLTPKEEEKIQAKATKQTKTLINQLNRYAAKNLNCSIFEDGSVMMDSGIPDVHYADQDTLKDLRLHLDLILKNI
ncbi:hypothetical protein GT360_11125 [Vibrio astriarenae]|uniref:Uncharacterized protein n=1 Tax=Vibrio astriarenae TaxID=1481923 RepID=A0A7Z2YEE1_9VIBR|nr:hypothetical protein [Vibrio astriarenae]QIA64025.1 hypothetical protein GT360_11125 [Vibrio astriarenae]